MKNFVGFIFFFTILGGSGAAAFGIVRMCAVLFANPDSSSWEYAFVSESPRAYSYHYSEDCKALRKTEYDIIASSVEEAEDFGYEPCSLCLKESVRYMWDDWACALVFPILCLILWIINKIERFHKLYKLRNPVVKRATAE